MKYEVITTKLFRKQYKRAIKRGYTPEEIWNVIDSLSNDETPNSQQRAHRLRGIFSGIFELHIRPDLLLMYQYRTNPPLLKFFAIGTHAELFE